ncbi:structure-specific endonuclease subunit slx1-like [Atheta coriaria]|uniref:structure-specific endonuclease subunit slx1-like n=1 Tax=Dalotia coriaria TaxID=877792 RepID=UPI0031F40AA6
MTEEAVIENFHGVYLLYCKNPKYLGRTYIGYTVNPNRRIKQHNKGTQAGGARRTSKKGPWTMVMIIHGFPNDIAALRFEWAWQHPTISRRLNKVQRKKPREKVFDYCLRILSEMLRVGPWNRLPLTVRWLDESFKQNFALERRPPLHMPIVEGTVISKKLSKSKKTQLSQPSQANPERINICSICYEIIVKNKLECINNDCSMTAHLICLSKLFLKPGEFVPIVGKCPKCDGEFLWGDLIGKLKGFYRNEMITIKTTEIDEELSDSDEN